MYLEMAAQRQNHSLDWIMYYNKMNEQIVVRAINCSIYGFNYSIHRRLER